MLLNLKKDTAVLYLIVMAMFLGACKDAWDEHTEFVNTSNKLTLAEQIAAEPQLSRFNDFLVQTGTSELLNAGKVHTVWAPVNTTIDSITALYPEYFTDSANLASFVKYHITESSYPVSKKGDTLNLKTLNGKYRVVIGSHIEEGDVIKADNYANNGVLHIINRTSLVKKTIWELAHSNIGSSEFLKGINSLDTVNGNSIRRNSQWTSVVDKMKNDSVKFTYFVLENSAYINEYNKIQPYFTNSKYDLLTTRPDSTTRFLTTVNLFKDLLVSGLYTPDNLPGTLTSVGGVNITVDKSAIVSSYRASNGIVYVVNNLPYKLRDRIKEFKIEGENFASRNTSSSATVLRFRTLKDTSGVLFNDFYIYSHRTGNYDIKYRADAVHNVVYKVYARSISGLDLDPHSKTTVFTMRHLASIESNPYIVAIKFSQPVDPSFDPLNPNRRYREVYLGEYTKKDFGMLFWWLRGDASSTDNDLNALTLDYIRFAPVLPN